MGSPWANYFIPLVVATSTGIAFAPAQDYETGSSRGPGPGASTTIAADIDGDGDVDVVATDWFGDGPLVLRNTGRGSFEPPTAIAGAEDVGALATGDVNGDRRPDLVGREAGGVVVMIGKGDGSFEVAQRLDVPSNAQQSVAVADVNGDSRLDIVTPETYGIQVLFGAGDGRFSKGPVHPLMGLLADIKPADLDGDAATDLVIADATPMSPRVVALRGKGDGTFADGGAGVVGYGPEAVMAGDLDGDGHDDVVSADSFSVFNAPPSFSITVLLSDGGGGFRTPATYATGDGPVSGALADFDANGTLDVAMSAVGSSVVTVYAGDGNGRLTEVVRVPVVNQPQTPVAADLDGDGALDLAVPGVGSLSVARNTRASLAPATPSGTDGGTAASPRPASDGGQGLPASGALPPPWVGVGALLACLVIRRRRHAATTR